MDLSQFISKEIEAREWTLTELARRAELAGATVSDVLNGKTRPGLRFYIGVARALGVSVDHLLRLAGELPASIGKVDDLNPNEGEVIELWRSVPDPAAREYMLKLLRGWAKEFSE